MKEMHLNMSTGQVKFNDTNRQASRQRQGNNNKTTKNQIPTQQGDGENQKRKLTKQQKAYIKQAKKNKKEYIKNKRKKVALQRKMQNQNKNNINPNQNHRSAGQNKLYDLNQDDSDRQIHNSPQPNKNKRRVTQNTLKRRRKTRKVFTFFLITLFIVVGAIVSINVFFKFEEIRIDGETQYTEADFEKILSLEKGESIFSFNNKYVEKEILKNLEYVEDVRVLRRLPSTVVIKITPSTETYLLENSNGYLVLSQGMKILRKSDGYVQNLCTIKGISVDNDKIGETVNITVEEKMELLNEMFEKIDNPVFLPLSEINLTEPYNISFTINNKYKVVLGTTVELDYKLKLVEKVITEELTNIEKATLDASSASSTQMVWVKENVL